MMVQSAVIRCIEVVGEAARRIDKIDAGFKAANPNFEIDKAWSARNALIHGYDAVDSSVVWFTATQSIQTLAVEARRILAAKGKSVP